MSNLIFTWSGTGTSNATSASTSIMMTPDQYAVAQADADRSTVAKNFTKQTKQKNKEEKMRDKSIKYTNKFVLFENRNYAVFCVKNTENDIHYIDTRDPHCIYSVSLNIAQGGYRILSSSYDKDSAVKICEKVFTLMQEKLDSGETIINEKLMYKSLFKYCGLDFPTIRVIPNQNLPQIYEGEIILSKNMQRILGTYCPDNKKKATALCKQIIQEVLAMAVLPLQQIGAGVPEQLCLPAPQLRLPAPDNKQE